MGRLMREFNWAQTSLGTPEEWPQSLRTTVGILLNSRFPMFLFWGPDLIQFYNDAYRPSLGAGGKHPTALGQKAVDCWPEIWADIHPLLQQVLAGGDSTWSEDQLLPFHRNGQIEDIYWTFSYGAVRNDSGEIGGVLTVCQETTDKVRSLQQLAYQENELAFAVEATELGIWDHNPVTGYFSANSRLKSWFGLGVNEQVALTDAVAAMAEEDRERVAAAIEKALNFNSGGSYEIEYRIQNLRTGQQRIVRAKGRAEFNSQKQPYRFAGTLQDITEAVAARKELEEAEKRFRTLAETLPNMVWVTDSAGNYEYTSVQWKAYSGLDPEDPGTWVKMIHPDEFPALSQAWAESLANQSSYKSDARLRNRDGVYLWHKIEGVPVKAESGEVIRWVGSCTNIHDQKTFSEKLSALVAERTAALERSNEDLQQFAHVASHDLKEPVRKIKTFAGQLEKETAGGLSKIGSLYLQKVQGAADRMFNMIDGVLHYSTISALEQEEETVDLIQLVRSIESDLELVIAQKGAQLHIGALPLLKGTSVLLYQLFYNLINNALKFSDPARSAIITLEAQPSAGGKVVVTVTDNGIGFEPEYAGNIFKTFTRLHSKDKYEGTGLGLSLCKKIVERHGGTIWAEGKVGQGARFIMELPAGE